MKAEVNEKSGEADITMSDGNETLNVKVGKNRKGFRTISINGKKALYSIIWHSQGLVTRIDGLTEDMDNHSFDI